MAKTLYARDRTTLNSFAPGESDGPYGQSPGQPFVQISTERGYVQLPLSEALEMAAVLLRELSPATLSKTD